MAITWNDLLADVMTLTESEGATDIENVAKIYLFRALKYISRKAELNGLVGTGTYTWLSTDVNVPITSFGITDFQTPYFLMVGNSSSTETPVPYEPLPYKDWRILKGAPLGTRLGLSGAISDQRPERVFTINYNNEVLIEPVVDSKTVELHYFKSPQPFGTGMHSPPLVEDWNDLIVDGAVLLTRAYIENPGGEKINVYKILSALDEPIKQLKLSLESTGFRRTKMRISSNYSPTGASTMKGVAY